MFCASIAFCFRAVYIMAPKKSKKRIKAQRATVSKDEAGQSEKTGTAEENLSEGKMDFGGLPDRDLKKNLGGCG